MRYVLLCLVSCLSACSSLGFTNEDAGLAALASEVSVPVNGKVTYTIEREPKISEEARQWNREMGVSRGLGGWFSAGKAKTYVGGGS